ncbi:O-antigen ligase family protein [Mycolicibacterium neoaurum]|uniref:O-antigen ligase family protein n=1 Tax=Mycolicibacterium neoaurum TaxID=1795 RepID=UPI0004BE2A39|nr:O-antigen ligase family protein [Mycolicibacterium neoaurum]TLH59052.1 hypothetical protein C1S81_13300 [Mycolicibacterium neoaurum]
MAVVASTLLGFVWLFLPDVAVPLAAGLAAVGAILAFFKYPLSVTVALLFLAQETVLSRQWLMTLGNDIYYAEILSVPVVLIIALSAWAVAVFRESVDGETVQDLASTVRVAVALLCIAFGIASMQAVVSGMSVLNTARQIAYPVIAVLVMMEVARRRFAVEAHALMRVGATCTIALAALGLITAAETGDSFVFYDSATAFIAVAVICVIFVSDKLQLLHVLVLVCAVAIIALSNRRSIVVGLLIALIIFAISKRGRVVRSRIVLGSTLAIGVLSVVAGPALAITLQRLNVGLDTIRGLDADVSTREHVSDLSIGLEHALRYPGGFGAEAAQLGGLAAVRSQQIYVHNEFLQLWLKHGILVSGLVAVAIALLTTLAFRSSQRPISCDPGHWALARGVTAAWPALFFALMTAPFISTTARWPALIGIMVVLLSASVTLREMGGEKVMKSMPSGSSHALDRR